MEDVTPEEVIKSDQQFFRELGDPEDSKIIGSDQAENAVAFAEERVEIFYGVNARIWANPVSCSHITFFVGCSLLPPNRKSTGIRTIRTTPTLRGANQSSRTETHTPNPLLPLDLHYSIRNVHPEEIGLVNVGLPLNPEQESLPADVRQGIEPVDLMIPTGCVGYVTENSFKKLMLPLTER